VKKKGDWKNSLAYATFTRSKKKKKKNSEMEKFCGGGKRGNVTEKSGEQSPGRGVTWTEKHNR